MEMLPIKNPGATISVHCDFRDSLFEGEQMLQESVVVVITQYAGLADAVTLAMQAAGVSHPEIIVTLSGGDSENVYLLEVSVDTSDGQHLLLKRLLPVFEPGSACLPDDFIEEVRPYVGRAGLPIIRDAIAKACRDFLERSTVYQPDIPAMDVVASQWLYTPRLGAMLLIGSESVVRYKGIGIPPLDEAGDFSEEELTGDQTGIPRAYEITPDRKQVRLLPKPDETITGALTIEASVYPSDEAIWFPNILATKYRTAIGDGAKARLLGQEESPWGNPRAAKRYEDAYECEISALLAQVATHFTRAPLRTKLCPI